MDRIFLAIIVSGVLLIAVSTCLFVLSSGDANTVSVNVPSVPSIPAQKLKPNEPGGDRPVDRPTR
jgi:hypothetical protein